MKARIFFIFILGIFIMICLGLFTLRHLHGEKIIDETRTVFIKKTDTGFQLFRNGKPFYIQGASGNSHLKELSLINGNTIRLYDTLNLKSFLDEAQSYGLAVIVDIHMPQYKKGKFNIYLNEEHNFQLKQNVRELVKKYHSHPALLMWNLGNELNYPIVLRKNSYINTFNDLIDIVHKEDPNHPVGTVILRKRDAFGIHLHSPKIDVIGFNVFGNLKELIPKTSIVFFLTKPMPYYISEWSINGPWEEEMTMWKSPIEQTSTKKGEQCLKRYSTLIETNNQSLGSLLFYWGHKQECTHTWFSIFDEQGRKSQIYYDLQSIWANKSNLNYSIPQIKYMLVNDKGARDQLIFRSNEIVKAQLFLDSKIDSSLQYNWEIFEEDWVRSRHIIPKSILGGFKNLNDNKVTFRVPAVEGPYRIFAYVYDLHGNFATTNTPFYVLNPK